MKEVYVADVFPHYVVFVDGKKYDEFQSTRPISWSEQWDIAAGYKEALENYVKA